MKRLRVQCRLCGQIVKLTKGGALPEHMRPDAIYPQHGGHGRSSRPLRCDGMSLGLKIALSAVHQQRMLDYFDRAHVRALHWHWAAKSRANSPAWRRRGWPPYA